MSCINKNTKEFKQLQELTKEAPVLLAIKIKQWQKNNNSEEIPSYAELTGYSVDVVNAFRSDLSLSEIGSILEYYNYLKTEENPSKEGFRQYVLDNTMISKYNLKERIKSPVGTDSRNVDFNDLISEDSDTIDNLNNVEHVYSKFDKIVMNGESTASGKDVVNNLIKEYGGSLNETVLNFMQKLSKVKGLEHVTFKINDSIEGNDAQYDNETRTIYLNRAVLSHGTVDNMLSAVLHELVHYRTVEALMNPTTQEDIELKEVVDVVMNKFRNDQDYGFENEYEFVAELYSNPEFRNKIIDSFENEKGEESIFQRLYNAIRRLFGMAKTSEYDKLFKIISNYVEGDYGDNTSFSSGLFNKRTDKTDYFDDISKYTTRINDLIKDNIDVQVENLNKLVGKSATKNTKITVDAKNKIVELKKIFKELEKDDSAQNLKAYIDFLNSMSNQIKSLEVKGSNLESTFDKPSELIKNIYKIEKILNDFEIIEDLDEYYKEIIKNSEFAGNDEMFNEFKKLVRVTKYNKNKLEKTLHDNKKDLAESLISDPRFNTKIETKYRETFEKEYGTGEGQTLSKKEFVKKRFDESKEEYERDLRAFARDLVYNPKKDISKADLLTSSSLAINSDLFQVTLNMVYQFRDQLEKSVSKEFREIDKLHKEFTKSNKELKPSEKYKNLLTKDTNGNYYFKNKYDIKLLNSYRDMINEAHNELYGKRTPFKITKDELNAMKGVGSGVLLRNEAVSNVKEGVPVNVQHADKTSSITPIIDSIQSYKNDKSTTRDKVIRKYTEFNNYQELVDSKQYDRVDSKGSKANPEIYQFLKEDKELFVYRYNRHSERVNFRKTKAFDNWLTTHFEFKTVTQEDGKKKRVRVVKEEYLDKSYNSLSEVEKQILDKFNSVGISGTSSFGKFNSLETNIFKGVDDNNVSFIRLPSSEKTTQERRFEREFKEMYSDFKYNLKNNENDDYDIGEPLDKEGKALYGLRVHNRGYIDPSKQSLEIFDLMAAEVENEIKHVLRRDLEAQMKIIADISAGKKYVLKSTKTGNAARNSKRSRQPIQLFEGRNSNEYAKILGLMETAVYDIHSYNGGRIGGYEINKITGLINGMTASIALTMNAPTGIANIINGRAQLQLDAIGGYHFNSADLASAEKTYFAELGNSLLDLNQPIKKSKVNLTLEFFDYIGGMSMKKQSYLKDTYGKKLLSTDSSNAYNEMGEHYMGYVIVDATLKGIKVMNKDGRFIDKEGKTVKSEKEAASLSDMIEVKDGELTISPLVVYTSFTPTVKLNEGGLAHIRMLIKKKSEDMYGSYDSNLKPEIQKTFWGKSVMMFKRFFIPGLQYRYRGYTTINTHPDDLSEESKTYNTAIKEYEEGYYITTLKLVINTIKNLKVHGLKYAPDYYNKLNDYQKANVRKTIAELTTRGILLPALGLMFALGWDDDDKPYWLMYQIARLSSELAQFSNPLELTKMATNPVAGLNFVQNALKLGGNILSVVNVDPDEGESYFGWLDEDNKGNNKLVKSGFKVVPVTSQFNREYQNLYNQIK